MKGLKRKGHFMGAKIRSQRKSAGLTLEELSMRCVQFDAERAPSVSYLSMIETGKRVPSVEVLELLAEIFQKEPRWFLDENLEVEPVPKTKDSGGVEGIPLEPGFLFAPDMLQRALPELLSQTGATGRQFAHLLIRTYQEKHRNEFPDIEHSAEEAGEKQMPAVCRLSGVPPRRPPVMCGDFRPSPSCRILWPRKAASSYFRRASFSRSLLLTKTRFGPSKNARIRLLLLTGLSPGMVTGA